MNTQRIATSTRTAELPRRSAAASLVSLGLASVLTLALMLAVDTLASIDAAAPQMAQASAPRA